ncbi:hypothetical protein MPTK1_5g10370 [Marchantia polymorpha subsp. ruderalis]|uniref:Uncharacterized protein n=2 Tax=Marchantia polymorpha TaxID=3197 RepID=A0AAF6BGX1_MARPO|nr:hypothetical protein MARPO_0048s0034 [Marchantia polymorpha]BBN11255.1 hypothetical protein Mp_5g10370 [Marchantia polymorpha subsp. ruderalis]|eukprot:PTQ38914.1 hypothetical protein MARPO_0048s0034 [Marchantia polymorpha]
MVALYLLAASLPLLVLSRIALIFSVGIKRLLKGPRLFGSAPYPEPGLSQRNANPIGLSNSLAPSGTRIRSSVETEEANKFRSTLMKLRVPSNRAKRSPHQVV